MNNILNDPSFVFEPSPHLVTWTTDTLREQGVFVGYAINEYFGGSSGGPLLVDNEFDNSPDDAALRENSLGQDWWESRNVPPSELLTLDTTDVGGNSTKKAALKNFLAGGNAYVTQNFGTPQNASFSVSFDMYIDRIKDDGDYDRTGYMFIGTDGDGTNGPNSTSAERFVFLTFFDPTPGDTGSDLEVRAREYDNPGVSGPDQPWADTSTWTPVASGLSYDTWYTITVDVHVSSGTYNVHIDDADDVHDPGVIHVSGINKFEKYTSSSVTHISFHTGDQGTGDFYVDNVLEVINLPDCQVLPTFLDFGSDQGTLTFEVENVGDESFDWTASADQPWIASIAPDNSSAPLNPGESVTVSVTIDRDLLDSALPDSNCRLWGAISDTGIPTSVISADLITDPDSLKNLTSATQNNDGWAMGYYLDSGNEPVISRGAEYALHSNDYDDAANDMANLTPMVAVMHVRNCTSGCCDDGGETIDDPHQFYRQKNGKSWLFQHNGDISKTTLRNLIGDEYYDANPPDGSGVAGCDPNDWSKVVDSELYFLLLLKNIEATNWNVEKGIIDTVNELYEAIPGSSETINFILTDGYAVWGFRKGQDLAYYYDSGLGYSAVASQPSYPGGGEAWITMQDHQLVTLRSGEAPRVIDVTEPPSNEYTGIIAIDTSHGESMDVEVVVEGPDKIPVPNVVGMTQAQAEAAITSYGLVVGSVTHQYSPTVPPGDVISQSPTGGTLVVEGSVVDLLISLPPVIIDNGDDDTSFTGTWEVSGGLDPYGVDSLFSRNGATYTYTFEPTVSGHYNVSMWWTEWSSRSTNAPIDIQHADGTTTVYVDQRINGGQWNSLGSFRFEEGLTYNVTIRALGSPSTSADAVKFTKEGILRHKWTTDLPGTGQIMPVMGDIDNDGDQEIVMAAGKSIVAVNGKTGDIEWSIGNGDGYSAVELVDLNNDGTPEVLHGMKGPRLRALNGNGSIRWTSALLKGEGQTLFPIVAFDIDGDGYPTIYFASEDTTPDPYSGNPDDYDGALTMLDHNGNVLTDTWIRHPCWSGPTLGDADFDGVFEIYLGDRRDGYHDMPAGGLQAFNAHTLEQLWARPDIHHSSPHPILADVLGDSNLELVATEITLAGPMILDPITGETIEDDSFRNLPTHGTPTVYDIDEDGNLEFITATSYPSTAPRNFVVFDLIDKTIDFEASFDFWITWPPKVGDVTGDGHMEILVATGSQYDEVGDTHDGNYPLLVYDKDFTLIDRVDLQAGQLTPARVYDTDSDGYNEVVVAGFDGKLVVYDTDAPTPDPAPRTWVQFYSEYRQGAAEYVPPPGP